MARRPTNKPKPRRAKGAAAPRKARPDPRAQRKQERADRTRDAILDAAAEVITRVGPAATTMELVAQQAGYSVGSLYNYFKSKDALVHSLTVKVMKDLGAVLARPLPASLTARQRLEALILRQLEHVERSRGFLLAMIQEVPVERQDELELNHDELLALRTTVTDAFASCIRDAIAEGVARQVDAQVAAVFATGAIKSLVLDWAARGGEGSATDLVPMIVELLFDGIGPRGAAAPKR